MSIEKEYPFTNNWRKGCWVKRPNGKPDRDYVYGGEFVKGSTHKASGMVRYTLAELGGPGWIVYKDIRRVRSLVEVGELTYIDHGEITAGDILRVAKAGVWDGSRCPRCTLGVLLDGETLCVECVRDDDDREHAAASTASAPDAEPF